MDMSKAEYEAMLDKTYAPENAEALKSALGKLDERKAKMGMITRPTEYYAVRQENNRKFSVCTISADGLVTTVKPNLTSIAEAKKAMLEIFEQRQDSVRVEFDHPLQDNLLKIGNEALTLNVPPAVMREAVYRQNNERTDKLAEAYEKLYERKHGDAEHKPESEKPVEDRPHKKPKR